MSNAKDFIIENGVLINYTGGGGDVIIPDDVVECSGIPPFMGIDNPLNLTLSKKMSCSFGDLLSEDISVLNIPAGTVFICSYCSPDGTSFFKQLKEINVDSANTSCASLDGILYSKDMTILYACPANYEGKVVDVPDTVKTIGEKAFAGCKKIKEIKLPESVEKIEKKAFSGCSALKKINLPDTLKELGSEAFKRCGKLTSAGPANSKEAFDLTFSFKKAIPDNAFSGMQKLQKAVLPSTVQKVGKNAFKNCKALRDLTMPQEAKVEKNTFSGCTSLAEITYYQEGSSAENIPAKSSKSKKSKPGFAIADNKLIAYNGKAETVIIPDGVTVIGRRAFYLNKNTKSVVIPESVDTIEQEAFCWCSNLISIDIKGKLKKVGANCFNTFNKKEFELQIYSLIPIKAFSKASWENALRLFANRFDEFDCSTEIYSENLDFIGKHLKEKCQYSGYFFDYLINNEALNNSIIDAKAIPLKDVDWVIEQLQQAGQSEFVARMLKYKDDQLSDPKKRKTYDEGKKKEIEKLFSTEMSVADWRKIFKLSYKDGYVIIKGLKISDKTVTIPAYIGEKPVKILGSDAFSRRRNYGETSFESPETIIISEGIEEFSPETFDSLKNCEIYVPSSVKSLPDNCFVLSDNIVLHLTSELTDISKDFLWMSDIKAICAPSGSYAETYAKENNIPFVAE